MLVMILSAIIAVVVGGLVSTGTAEVPKTTNRAVAFSFMGIAVLMGIVAALLQADP